MDSLKVLQYTQITTRTPAGLVVVSVQSENKLVVTCSDNKKVTISRSDLIAAATAIQELDRTNGYQL